MAMNVFTESDEKRTQMNMRLAGFEIETLQAEDTFNSGSI
jgi:hypothetical protein